MNEASQLLSTTRRTAEMGRISLENIIPKIEDRDLSAVAQVQHEEYTRVMTSADALLRADNCDVNGISGIAKTMDSVMIGLNTLTNRSSAHITSLLIQGADRAILEMDEAISRFSSESSPEACNLAAALRDILYRNRRELQRYC